MDALYLLLLFPIAWPFVAKRIWSRDISWREMGLNVGIVVLAVVALWAGGRSIMAYDVEIWNGQVTSKAQVWVFCEHSYECNCKEVCSGSGKDRTCSKQCETCHEHFNDWDWRVRTDIGDFTVSRIDSRGSFEPPRWTAVRPGQPVAFEHSFTNYIKAAPDSLFNKKGSTMGQYEKLLPKYPSVYDYHYADRVIPVGVTVADLKEWNTRLALSLRDLGPKKQANVIIVLASISGEEYSHALEEHWLGGKKNDIVVVLGVPEYPAIAWARVVSWTDKEIFKVALRDALLDLKVLDAGKVVATIERHVTESFVRKPMEDFKYLWHDVRPPTWLLAIIFVISIAGSVGLTFVFRQSEI